LTGCQQKSSHRLPEQLRDIDSIFSINFSKRSHQR
jgi:hypothetical protein